MGMPWAYGPKKFDVPAGESSLVQLNVPHRGKLRSFNIRIADGTSGSFEIYSSEAAAREAVANGNGSSASVAATIPAENYVIYDGTLTDGASVNHDMSIMYVNTDGTPTNVDARLWMRVTPAGVGTLSCVVALTVEGAEFR